MHELFGVGKDLTAIQMAARGVVVFFVTLVLVRVAGMRAFGRKSSFDAIVVIMLGAILSRAVVGASPAIPTIAASAIIVVLHRAVAIATAFAPRLERIVKGKAVAVYRDGELDRRVMRRHGISVRDLEEAVREQHGRGGLGRNEICFESSGELTVLDDKA